MRTPRHRVVAAQERRRWGVHEAAIALYEHAVGGEQPQHPVQRIGVGADARREPGGACGFGSQVVGDPQSGHEVQAPRHGRCERHDQSALPPIR